MPPTSPLDDSLAPRDPAPLENPPPSGPVPRRAYTLKTAAPAKGLVDYEALLNEEQRQVALCPEGPTLVIAGAGSGKTRALTYRVAHLLETGTPPERILLLTFTNRSAREMMSRVEAICRVDLRRLMGGTFHSVALALLKDHAPRLGYARRLRAARPRGLQGGLRLGHRRPGPGRGPAPLPARRRARRPLLPRGQHAAPARRGHPAGPAAVRRRGREDPGRRPPLRRAQGGHERDGLRRPAAQLEAPAGRARAGRLPLPARPLQRRAGRRVPGHQQAAGRPLRRAGRAAPQPPGGGRRRAEHLRLPRSALREHPALPRALARGAQARC